ncbi:MAG: glutathione S-transferase family protein [Terrimicrobiaceae bacterium]|nr:glutathione S-transferase family protein [Terrimicrobiaceae bacterium]
MNPPAETQEHTAQFPLEQGGDGSFQRQKDAFRRWVKNDKDAEFPAVADRYHLYVSLACPWAHRIILLRRFKGLESAIGLTVVDPIRNDTDGWAFRDGPGHTTDPINGFRLLKEAYLATDPSFSGRVTVPVLWDKHTRTIVSNSDDDLLRMLNSEFNAFARNAAPDFYPEPLRAEIDRLNEVIYQTVNDGVYRAGFATTQEAYEKGVYPLFDTLDLLETRLGRSRFLFGDQIVETDIRLFVSLIRFDPVYHGHFKCNLRRIADYQNLSRFLADFYELPGVAETVNFDHIKRHYYVTHDDINPTQIVPVGPWPLLPRKRS